MSAAPDPAELAPSRDPAAYGRRPLFTTTFFAWVSLCVICIVAGAAIGRFEAAPPAAEKPAALAPPVASAPAAPTTQAAASTAETAPPSSAPAATPDLDARLARLEASNAHLSAAAAQALAAASLSVATQGPGPFEADLAAYQRLAPGDPDLTALAPLAPRGAPTAAALAAALPPLASDAAAAARQPDRNASLLAKVWALIGKVVMVRRVDPAAGGVDGALARAQSLASLGDLKGAVAVLQTLPPAARAQLSDWQTAADARVDIDAHVASLRARALAALAQAPPS
ncbi:MAG TPA: hypothetical protein VGL58_02615 [Caulobacteraceae bacterium]|jgi:hypothetical protein